MPFPPCCPCPQQASGTPPLRDWKTRWRTCPSKTALFSCWEMKSCRDIHRWRPGSEERKQRTSVTLTNDPQPYSPYL